MKNEKKLQGPIEKTSRRIVGLVSAILGVAVVLYILLTVLAIYTSVGE